MAHHLAVTRTDRPRAVLFVYAAELGQLSLQDIRSERRVRGEGKLKI